VRHVLQGSVQKSGNTLRVTAQLVDGTSGAYIWSERYDRNIDDLFDLQDEIVRKVLIELQVKLTVGETARVLSRGTRNLEAWIFNTQATALGFKFTQDSMIRARELYSAAATADPEWANPVGGLAWTYYEHVRRGWSKSVKEDRERGMELARRAIEMDATDPLGYMQLGNLYIQKGDYEEGIALREKALELSPSDFYAMAGLAWRLPFVGQEKRALELYQRARKISPLYPWWLPAAEGLALHVDGQLERAISSYQESLAMNDQTMVRGRLAAVYADLDRIEAAREQVRIAMEQKPEATVDYFLRVLRFQDPKRTEWYAGLLAKAGLSK